MAFGSAAVLAAQNLPRLAGAGVLVSSGTLLAALGTGQAAVTGGALLYMPVPSSPSARSSCWSSCWNAGARWAPSAGGEREAFGAGEEEDELREPGRSASRSPPCRDPRPRSPLRAAAAGLPPLSGFLAKVAMLAPLLGPPEASVTAGAWVVMAAMILSGLAVLVAMARTGIDVFWASPPAAMPRVSLLEIAPVGLLLGLCVGLTVAAGPAMDYLLAAAGALHAPGAYLGGVLGPAR